MSLRRSAPVTTLVCVAELFASAASLELTSANIAAVAAAFSATAVTAGEHTTLYLAHSPVFEPHLHALSTRNPRAVEEPRALDETYARSSAHHPASSA